MVASASDIPNLIPALEPLGGISLAVNVAYLNLRRFRYRDQVREVALGHVKELRGAKIDDLSQTKSLKLLAGESVKCEDLPAAVKGFLAVYGKELDMKAAFAFSLFSAIILAAGVAVNIKIWALSNYVGGEAWVAVYFYILLFTLMIPSLAVYFGRSLSTSVIQYADRCNAQISSTYDEKVDQATVPEIPAAAAPPRSRSVPIGRRVAGS
ncbi:hypothetical protein [uncultured Sphingomonas sp.]|uniref:hypothetical protein n=1 Tax=uncultured Sphingomonas sp. TaxID=158754 RepID=UPI002600B536|nr:hypothetical protein [uncultured Sphingomonas sp.]